MSYSGTVRCGNCYGKGHNRRGCPELKLAMEKRLAADPEDWAARRYFEKKKGAKVRKCTFCKEQGHNRATCSNLKTAKAEWITCNAKFREEALAHMHEAGIGRGALVTMPEIWDSHKSVYLKELLGVVTEIDWDTISISNWDGFPPNALTAVGAGTVTSKSEVVLPYSKSESRAVWGRGETLATIMSPCSGSTISPPLGWLGGLVSRERINGVFENDTWGEKYCYDTQTYIPDTCDAVVHAKRWEKTLLRQGENK